MGYVSFIRTSTRIAGVSTMTCSDLCIIWYCTTNHAILVDKSQVTSKGGRFSCYSRVQWLMLRYRERRKYQEFAVSVVSFGLDWLEAWLDGWRQGKGWSNPFLDCGSFTRAVSPQLTFCWD